MSVATEQMICQEHLRTVVYVHDDNGRGRESGRLPFELEDTFIHLTKIWFRQGLGCHGHQFWVSGDMQHQVHIGNEQTGALADRRVWVR